MIAYFDTSALVPLLVAEPTTSEAARYWRQADRAVSVRMLYPEARAALAQARRMRRLTRGQLAAAVGILDTLDAHVDHVEVTPTLARRAGQLAEAEALRAYDAVHLAAAESIADDELIVVAGDGPLLSAAHRIGLAVADIARGSP